MVVRRKFYGNGGSTQCDGATLPPRGATTVPAQTLGVIEPKGVASPATTQIISGGVYEIADNFTCTITIDSVAAAAGVRLRQANSGTTLTNVNIVVNAGSSGSNLWIEKLNITNTLDKPIIQFSNDTADNVLTISGNSTLSLNADLPQSILAEV